MKNLIFYTLALLCYVLSACDSNKIETDPDPEKHSFYSFRVDEKNVAVEEVTEKVLIDERINQGETPLPLEVGPYKHEYTNSLDVEYDGDYDYLMADIEDELYLWLHSMDMSFPVDYDNTWHFTPSLHEKSYIKEDNSSAMFSLWLTYRYYHHVTTRTVTGEMEIKVLSAGEMTTIKGKWTAVYNYVLITESQWNLMD